MWRLTTLAEAEICTFESYTFEEIYTQAVKVWDALTTLGHEQRCDGILLQKADESNTEDDAPEVWTTILRIDYTTHER